MRNRLGAQRHTIQMSLYLRTRPPFESDGETRLSKLSSKLLYLLTRTFKEMPLMVRPLPPSPLALQRLALLSALALACTGVKGDKGDKGDQGDIGPQGPVGPAPMIATDGGFTGTGAVGSPLAIAFAGNGTEPTAAHSDHVHVSPNYGKLTVYHGNVDLVTVPWTAAEVIANYGRTIIWAGVGPNLRDTTNCAGGANPSVRVDHANYTEWPGQYLVTFTSCNTLPCLVGRWSGMNLTLSNSSDTVFAGPAAGRVDFTFSNRDDVWRTEHMFGQVGTTGFECH